MSPCGAFSGVNKFMEKTLPCLIQTGESFSINLILGSKGGLPAFRLSPEHDDGEVFFDADTLLALFLAQARLTWPSGRPRSALGR